MTDQLNRHRRSVLKGGTVAMALLSMTALSTLAAAQEMTDVGTPRDQTLIVDILRGRIGNPTNLNTYHQGVTFNQGMHQLAIAHLWDIDTSRGTQIPVLAAEMPEPLNDDYTRFRVKLREGLKWSDGVDFSADDVVYTDNMLRENDKLSFSRAYTSNIKSMTKVDSHTIEIETTRPTPRLAIVLGSVIYGNAFHVVPKHIWEKEDPTTFQNFPPVTIDAYKLADHDPNGSWVLWEKREDWQNTPTGQVIGEPAAKYVLFRAFGTEERRVLAMANNDIDILTDISPESFQILKSRNDKVRAWFDAFPYANMDDPCERGMQFNNAVAPFDQKDVRWALTLAINLERVSIATFSGMMRASPLPLPPTSVLTATYHKPMTEWLKEYTLDDGYKPFDPDFATRLSARLIAEGTPDIPDSADAQRDLFGVGWWKYDVEQAAKLLEGAGFKRENNVWLTPEGTPWRITILSPADFEVQSQRLAFAVANEWNSFGVQTSVQPMQSGAFFTAETNGNYEVGSYWSATCGIIPDAFVRTEGWHKEYFRPVGEPAAFNKARYVDDELSALIDKLRGMPSDHAEIVPTGTEILKRLVDGNPFISMFGTSKFVPVNETYWTNYPSANNPYEGPWWWWSNFKFINARLKPAGQD